MRSESVLTPQATPFRNVAELFAGVGGFRLALEGCAAAGLPSAGWRVGWSNQWEPATRKQHASNCYVKRFGHEGHLNEDIAVALDALERMPTTIGRVDLIVGGFPCFAAGTMVLTAAGHVPIEEITPGELVLTDRARWRRVTAVMSRPAPSTLAIRGQGFPDIRTTAEHPFWSRARDHVWMRAARRQVRRFHEPRWVPAGELNTSIFVSQVYPSEHVSPPLGVEVPQNADFYWVVGRYLADGWRTVNGGKGRVVICASFAEADQVEARIRRVFPCTRAVDRTTVKFHITRTRFCAWLESFGRGARGKRIPGWVFALDTERARALLDGYLTGDGSPWQGGWKATTISRSLALGIALLAQRSHGVVASIHETEVPAVTSIEGRTVNQQKQYQIVVPPRNRSAFIEGCFGWKRVRQTSVAGPAQVFNLSVEEDESYVADGCVVHNCQDYSVARLLKDAGGIEGKKGVLWWEIHRFVKLARPRFLLLENVDRLLKSPAHQRGRDFGVMLRCLADLGYTVEWRVANAADHGFPQRRRRTFIVAQRDAPWSGDVAARVLRDGVLARALPATLDEDTRANVRLNGEPGCVLPIDLVELSDTFAFEFQNAGVMRDGRVWTYKLKAAYEGPRQVLRDVLVPEDEVPREYFIPKRQVPKWRYLKGAKREAREVERNGFRYFYSEGALTFPDPLDRPSRTILTGEGGSSPSRFKHVVETPSGRLRRLVPVELERLNGFPDGWTDTGMPDPRRAFCMGNALVVGLVHRIARELAVEAG